MRGTPRLAVFVLQAWAEACNQETPRLVETHNRFPRQALTYLSRRITSPWPTSWSLSHSRYLKVAPLMPTRGGPLSRRMPAGAWNTLDENGQRLTSHSTRRFPASEIQATWSPSSSTTVLGITPTSTGRSAILSLILLLK